MVSYERTSDGGLRSIRVTAAAARAAYDYAPADLREGEFETGFTVYRLLAPNVRMRSATYTPITSIEQT